MALAVAHVGGNVSTGTGTITSSSWTSTAGSDIIVIGHIFATAGAAANGDITDSKSNTYTLLGSSIGTSVTSGIAMWHSNNTTRGASHTVTYNPTASAGTGSESINVAVVEITGQDSSADFDATTLATFADNISPFSPFNVTASAAISGNQIAVYGTTLNAGSNFAFTQPTGYTNIINTGNGAAALVSLASYKIDETGTPTVGATRTDSDTGDCHTIIATFKEAAGGGATVVIPPSLFIDQSVVRSNLY